MMLILSCNCFINSMSRGFSLAYNWDDVNLIVQLLHKLDVQGFQPVTRRRHKIETSVNSAVRHVRVSGHLGLSLEERLILGLDIVKDRLPATGVVHCVAEARCVHYCEGQVYTSALPQ